jgi:hypothetical protein
MLAGLIASRRDWMPVVKLLIRLTEGKTGRFVVPGTTAICIEGYPRSANSVAVRLFRRANNVHIAHHTHAVANVRVALQNNIPVLCLIRDPLEAISSNLVRSDHPNVRQEIADYQHFYRFILQYRHLILMTEFDAVINRFDEVINAVNRKFGTDFSSIDNPHAGMDEVMRDIRNRYEHSDMKNGRERKIPVPDAARRELKEHWKSQLVKSPDYLRIRSLYDRLTDRIQET